mmetsp:Transcript_21642/g.69897  ORF Transcript_21642/g.69897 Transcript_21642/m.69897 type:complete len:216 (+) Transcript_21642:996-1643(+)
MPRLRERPARREASGLVLREAAPVPLPGWQAAMLWRRGAAAELPSLWLACPEGRSAPVLPAASRWWLWPCSWQAVWSCSRLSRTASSIHTCGVNTTRRCSAVLVYIGSDRSSSSGWRRRLCRLSPFPTSRRSLPTASACASTSACSGGTTRPHCASSSSLSRPSRRRSRRPLPRCRRSRTPLPGGSRGAGPLRRTPGGGSGLTTPGDPRPPCSVC